MDYITLTCKKCGKTSTVYMVLWQQLQRSFWYCPGCEIKQLHDPKKPYPPISPSCTKGEDTK
jgi:transcription elongation factor Elf1